MVRAEAEVLTGVLAKLHEERDSGAPTPVAGRSWRASWGDVEGGAEAGTTAAVLGLTTPSRREIFMPAA